MLVLHPNAYPDKFGKRPSRLCVIALQQLGQSILLVLGERLEFVSEVLHKVWALLEDEVEGLSWV